jgi:hypothetical protein
MSKYDKGYDFNDIKTRLSGDILQKDKKHTVPTDGLIQLAQEMKISITTLHTERGGIDESSLVNRIYDTMRADATIELAEATYEIAQANIELVKESQTTSKSAAITAKWTRRLTYATWALVIVTIILYILNK